MEVQEGKGPWSRQVGGIVPIGSPLTLVIAINDNSREFDMRVKQCSASDGSGSEVLLTDNNGCVLRKSLLTPFAKIRDFGGKATLVAYSHLFAFKFPDTLDIFVHCMVEVCRHGCPDSCGGKLLTDYHPSPRERPFTLESKKQQKLAEFAISKQHNVHPPINHVPINHPPNNHPPINQLPNNHVPFNHQRINHPPINHPPINHPPINHPPINHPQINHPPLKVKVEANPTNSPLKLEVHGSLHRSKPQYLTQVPAHILQKLKSGKDKNKEVLRSEGQLIYESLLRNTSTASDFIDKHLTNAKHSLDGTNLHNVPFNVANNVRSKSEIESLATSIHIEPDSNKNADNHLINGPRVFSDVKAIPIGHYHRIIGHDAHWNSEEIKTQDEQYLNHHIPPLSGISYQPPQPEPAAWSADQVKPLSKEEVFQPHVERKKVQQPGTYVVTEALRAKVIPQPEPAAWSADDVKPLTKQEVFHPHISHHQTKHQISNFHKTLPQEPQPEPAPWTFDDVNPLHRPNIQHQPYLENHHLEEPKPEPAPWSFQDVKPLTKEDLKTHSLNYKLKTQSHTSDGHIPIYKESVVPFTNAPEPVYIPQYTPSPKNMSGMMMNMMMMMPTLLPYTYQTARWPQKTTARLIRPDRHHHPYPIPQFPHRQQMNLGVIADRREDSEESDLQYELDAKSHISSEVTDHNSSNSGTSDTENTEMKSQEIDKKSTLSDISESSILTEGHKDGILESQSPETSESRITESSSGVRPPIVAFVAPSLDIDEYNYQPENKDRSAHSPRALNHRRKRSSEPVFGVKQRFQAVALSDLAFELNLTSDSTAILKGRREEIIYGVCMSPASMSVGIGFILLLTLCSLMASLLLYEHSCRLRNKKSHLSLLTRTFNGRLESLYRVTRIHPNSSMS